MGRPSRDRQAQGIAAELARVKAALASAQDTIAWQRAEIDRLMGAKCGRADKGVVTSDD